MAVTPKQLEIQQALIQDAYEALEEEIVNQIIIRLNQKSFTELTEDSVFQWQLEKMQQLNLLNDETIKELVRNSSKRSEKQLKKLVSEMGYDSLQSFNGEMEVLTGKSLQWTDLDNILQSFFNQQWLDLENHVNQTLISTNYQINAIAQAYTQVLNDTVAKLATGFVSPDQAFRSAIYEWVDRGIMSAFIDKSGRQWSLESYVRMVLNTTTHRINQDLRLKRSQDFGIVTALMGSHSAAREACAPIQGGWVLTVRTSEAPEEFQYIKSIYDFGYGDPSGTQGIHCKHRLYPGIPGITNNNMPDPPNVADAQKNAETVAKQRAMERAIRAAKKQLNAAEQLSNDEDIQHFKQLIRKRQGALRTYINEHDVLHREYIREQVYS
ncbi:phage minor capsid protein [Enterococcus larvae]|uniref:phage minor capsid protein n=1 Tax=Enterococcus larvae TaxID=2794352 RepID=UPI003F3EEEF9